MSTVRCFAKVRVPTPMRELSSEVLINASEQHDRGGIEKCGYERAEQQAQYWIAVALILLLRSTTVHGAQGAVEGVPHLEL